MKLTAASNGAFARQLAVARARLRNLRPALQTIGVRLASEARRRAPRGDTPGRLANDRLWFSIYSRVVGEDEIMLGSPLSYARIQAFGGSIRGGSPNSRTSPKPRYLAVPLTDEARRLVGGATKTLNASQSLRSVQGLFVIRSKGKLLLVRSAKRRTDRSDVRKHRFKDKTVRVRQIGEHGGEMIEVLFVLVPAVTLRPNPPPRGYVPSMEEPAVRRMVGQVLSRWIFEGRAHA